MLTKNAIGNLINRYKAVLKKCRLLNTFGSLAVVSMLVAGSVGVAGANDVNISGTEVVDKDVSLKASGGSPAVGDNVTTDESSSGTFNLNIDGRTLPLNTMTIGYTNLNNDLTVTLKQGEESTTSISSINLNVVGSKVFDDSITTYAISEDLTHTVNGIVSLQGDEGIARLDVNGTLVLQTSTSGSGTTIAGTRGVSKTSQLYVTNGTLEATNGTSDEILNINHLNVTLKGATVNAASLILDASTTLTLTGNNTINASLNATEAITIGNNDVATLILKGGGNLEALTVGATSSGVLEVHGEDKVVVVDDFMMSDKGFVIVHDGATLDISNDADIIDALSGETYLNGGILKVNKLTINATDLIEGEAAAGRIGFDTDNGGMLSVNDTLTLKTNGTLVSGVNIETKSLAGVDTEVESGANLTFTGGGNIGANVDVKGIVNIQGTEVADMSAANQTNITDTLLLNGGTINVQNNAVLVLDADADLRLTANRSGAGEFNVQNTAALLLNDITAFNGNNVTNIAGVVNSVDADGDAQDFSLSNVNLQAGAQVGAADTSVSLSGIIDVEAMEEGQSAQILGDLIGDGVGGTPETHGSFNGTLNVAGDYISSSFNVFGAEGDKGKLNVNGTMTFTGGAQDTFNVAVETNAIVVEGKVDFSGGVRYNNDVTVKGENLAGDQSAIAITGANGAGISNSGSASLEVSGTLTGGIYDATNGKITDGITASITAGSDATKDIAGIAQMVVSNGVLGTVNIKGGDDADNTVRFAGIALMGVRAREAGAVFTVGTVNLHNGKDAVYDPTTGINIGNTILTVAGGYDHAITVGLDTKLVVTEAINGNGIVSIAGGDGAPAHAGNDGFDGGDAQIELKDGVIISKDVSFEYRGGHGGDGALRNGTQLSGGDGGNAIVDGSISDTYVLSGGDGGYADNGHDGAGIGGKGGDAILEATAGKTYKSITLSGGTAGDDSNGGTGGAGGAAIFNVTNEFITAEKILMDTENTSIVNVTVDENATNTNPQNTTLSVGEIDGYDVGARGIINITGTDKHTATLTVTGDGNSYIDTAALEVNIGLNGTLDLGNMQFANLGNFLSGAYNLNGGTLNVGGLRIDAEDLVSGEAAAGEIGFNASNGGKLDVDGLLIIRTATATAQLNDGVYIETQSLEGNLTGSHGVTDILLGKDGSTADSTLTFTGGGEIKVALTVAGNDADDFGGVLNIIAENDTGGALLSGAAATTIATGNITINKGGVLNVQDNGVLVLEEDGAKRLTLNDGEFNIANDGTLVVSSFAFDGKNITHIAGTVIEVDDATATTLDYQDLKLANVNLQGGAKLGSINLEESERDDVSTILSGTINVDANSTAYNAVTVFGNLRGDGVTNGDFDGILNVTKDYLSAATNTFRGEGMINVSGKMEFTNGANDFFALDIEADTVNVSGSDNKTAGYPSQADAAVTFAKNLTVTNVNLTGGDAEIANGGTTQMVVAGVLKAENVNITGGTNTDDFKGGGSQLVVDGGVGGTIGDLSIRGGDVATNTLTSSMNNAELVVQALGSRDNSVTISGDVIIENGVNAKAEATYGQGIAALIVAGGNHENGGAGRQTYVKISETVTGDGIIAVQGGTGETGGSGEGGDAKLDISDADLSNFTGTFSYQGGTGGDATNAAGGGEGGSAEIDGDKAQSYDLVGGTGGDAFGEFDGGDGGNALLSADSGYNYTKVTLTGGADGADTDTTAAGLGGAGGNAKFSIGSVESTVNTLIVNDGGTVEVVSFNDDSAALTVNDDFTDAAGAQIIVINGTLDLSAATINAGDDTLAGAYSVRSYGRLVLESLSIDAADLVSGINTPNDGQVSTADDGMLLVKDTLTLGGDGSIANNVNVTTQSLALATASSATGIEFTEGTLTFSGGGSIATGLTIGDVTASPATDAQMVVSYSDDTKPASGAVNITTASGNLTINNAAGLNVQYGAALDASAGTLTVIKDGFVENNSTATLSHGDAGAGTLIVSGKSVGYVTSSDINDYASDERSAAMDDAFWGTLEIKGVTGTISYADLVAQFVGNELVQGAYGVFDFVDATIDGSESLHQLLVGGPVVHRNVNIGTGIVQTGGMVQVDSVHGDTTTNILIDGDNTSLAITGGEADGGGTDLFTNAGSGEILVKNGNLLLGSADYDTTLDTHVVLGDVINASITGDVATTGHVVVHGAVDMGTKTITSVIGQDASGDDIRSTGNTVTVTGNGNLTAGFDLAAGDTLNVIAFAGKAAEATISGNVGDLNITGNGTEDASATVNINGGVIADGDVTLTKNAGNAILNIVAGDGDAAPAGLYVTGNFTNNGGTLNLTAGDATATGDGGSTEFGVDGTFTSTGDIHLTAGNALGDNDGGEVLMFLDNAELNDVNITSGKDDAAGGTGGAVVLGLGGGSVANVTVTSNSASNKVTSGFYVEGGAVTADSVTLKTTANAAQALLQVNNAGSLTVGALDASGSDVNVDAATLTVTGTYTDTATTDVFVYADGLLDLSATTMDKVTGSYDVVGTLQMDTLNIASDSLVDGANITAAGAIAFYNDTSTLKTTTLNLTDTTAATLAYGKITTATLNTADGLDVTVDTDLTFSGGGSINTNLTTGTGSVIIGETAGLDAAHTAATTTTLAMGKTLDITKNAGLVVLEGNALDSTQGTLKVVDGGFADTGTGQLIAKNEDFGAFSANGVLVISFNSNDATVKDEYHGNLVITGLSGIMAQNLYESFLIGGSNALIEGANATLKFEGVTTAYANNSVITDVPAGAHIADQIFKTGIGIGGEVVVAQPGKVVVAGVVQSDLSNPMNLIIKTGTILGLTAQGEAKGDAFYGDVIMENGAGFETGAADGLYSARVGGNVLLKNSSVYKAVGNTNIAKDITAVGTGGDQQVIVMNGAGLTLQDITLPEGSMTVQSGGSVLAKNVTLERLEFTQSELKLSTLGVGFAYISSGRMEIANALTIKELFITGLANDSKKAIIESANTHILGYYGSDPAFDSTPELSEANNSALGAVTLGSATTPRENGIFVAQNAMIATGTDDSNRLFDDLNKAIADGHMTWGPGAGQTSAALGIYKPLTMAANATTMILVDGTHQTLEDSTGKSYLADALGNTLITTDGLIASGSGLASNTAYFNANSVLVIDAGETGVGMTGDVALTGVGSSVLEVANAVGSYNNDAKLHIVDGRAGTLMVADGFATSGLTSADLWDVDAISVSSSVLRVADIGINSSGAVEVKLESSVDTVGGYTQFQGETVRYLNTYLLGENGVGLDTSFDAEAGQMLISRAFTEVGFGMGRTNEKRTVATIEGAAQMGAAANAASGTVAAGLAVTGAVGGRNSGLSTKIESGNSGSMTLNNGEVTAEVGVSGGNMAEKSGLGVWLTPLYKWNTGSGFESGGLEHGYDMGLGGIALGVDFTNRIAADTALRFGLAFNVGAGYSDSTGDYNETNNDFDFWGLTAYGAFQKENFVATLDIGFTSSYNDITQDLPSSLAMGDLSADVDTFAFSVGLNLEYTFNAGMMDITPHAGVRYMSVTTDEYEIESMYGRVATVEEDTQDIWYFPVGVTFSADIESASGWTFTPKLDLGFIAAAGDLEATSNTRFTGIPGTMELSMQNVDGFAFNGGVGFELSNPDNGISIGINYNLQAGEKETGHMIFANFRYDF